MLLVLSGGAIWNEPPGGPPDPPPTGPQPDPDPPGTPYFRFGTRSNNVSPSNFTTIASLHPSVYLRTAWGWGGTEPTQNANYQWGNLDTKAANAAAKGIRLLGVLSQAPAWATGGAGAGNKYPVGFQQDFYDFCAAAADRYRNTVEAWEIMNEPNLNNWTGPQVQEILIGASNAIHDVNPDAIVCGGCPSVPFFTSRNAGSIQPAAWSTLFNNAQARAAMDVATYHYYVRPFMPESGNPTGGLHEVLQTQQDWCDDRSFSKPLWITEAGYPAPPTEGLNAEVSEEDQARFSVRYSIICTLYPRTARYYQFQIFGSSTPGIEEGGMGLIRPNGTFKPAWFAVQTCWGIFDHTLIKAERVAHANPNVWIVKFWRQGQKQGYAIWITSGTASVTLSNLPSQVRKTDLLGTQTLVSTSNNQLVVTATIDPQYVEGWW